MVFIREWPNVIVTNTFQPPPDIATIFFFMLVTFSSVGIKLHSYFGS